LAALRKRDVAKLASVQEAQKSGDVVRWLASMVKVDFPGDAEIMSVSVTRNDPREAATLVQAIVDAYMTDIVDSERNQKRVRLAELDRAFIEKETDLRVKREDLKKLADTLGTVEKETLSLKQGVALEEWKELRKDLRLIQAEVRALKKELAMKKSALSDAKEPERDPILKQIKQVEANIAATTEQENEVKKQVGQSLKEVARLGSSVVDIDMMRNDIKNLDDILGGIARERERLRIEIRAMSRVTLLEKADVPETPD
jgi:chromosome segregation ATPase